MNEFLSTLTKEDRLTYELSMLYRQWGYKEYRMAKFEEYSFYSDNRDFLSSSSILAFNNSDGRLMALKPDITLSIVKNAKLDSALTKLFYNESVFRITESSNDFKEIKQTGVEVLGKALEHFHLMQELLVSLGGLLGLDAGMAGALGLVGLFCCATNSPLASIMLSVEMFGGTNIHLFAFVSVICFVLSGNYGLYASQILQYNKADVLGDL
jgi:hypothetical protein